MTSPGAQRSGRRPVRVTAAGWASIAMGVLAVLASVGVAVTVLVNSANVEVEPGTPIGQYRLLLLALLVGGIVVGLTVVALGASVLRGSLIGRYLLIGFWVVCGAAALFGLGPFEASLPVLTVIGASITISVLLSGRTAFVWFFQRHSDSRLVKAENRVRKDGSGTRGAVALAAAVAGVSIALYVEVVSTPEDSFWLALTLDPLFLSFTVAVLWYAVRALGYDGTRVWASRAVGLAIATPVVTSTVGLIDAIAAG